MRSKHQLTRDRVRIQLGGVSAGRCADQAVRCCQRSTGGVSSRRMLQALAAGETDAAKLAALADRALRATPEQLQEALSAASTLGPCIARSWGYFCPGWK